MQSRDELCAAVKQLIVDALMLKRAPDSIPDAQPLFGPNSVGLDSIDALQLVVALEKQFGISIRDSAEAQKILHSVDAIANHILASQTGSAT
jgi:acyl carrier protein